MAIKGLSKPFVAEYVNNGGTVSYKNGVIGGKAINYQIDVNTSEDNSLYADNGVAEQAVGGFLNAHITLGTDAIDHAVGMLLLGVKEVKEKVAGIDGDVTTYVLDEDSKGKEVGFGIIEEHQKNGVTFYRAVILPRVQFKIPSSSATTRGSNIDWQTSTINGVAIRSDETTEHVRKPWRKYADFNTELEAIKYLMAVLNVKADLKSLVVKSEAGADTKNNTKITVTPDKTGSNKYKYKIDTKKTDVIYGQLLNDWQDWDGKAEISNAETGKHITVAEVDLSNSAVGVGDTEVKAHA